MKRTCNRILVTGGAGFIGSEVVRQLVARRREIVVLDNLVNGKRENLGGIGGSVRLVIGDILNDRLLKSTLNRAEMVIHMACLGVRHSIHSPFENHRVNAEGTLRLLISAKRARIKRFVYVSSSEVYGTAMHVPISEEDPTFPTTVYGSSKLAGESYARAFHDTYGMPVTIVRPFNAYGPRCHHEGDSGEVIPKFLLRCLTGRPMVIFGDGKQTRDFTYVADTARGILLAAESRKAIGETINVGSGQEISINALSRFIGAMASPYKKPLAVYDDPRPGDVRRLHARTTKARRLLGFESTVSLEIGLRRLMDWYLDSSRSPQELIQDEQRHNWSHSGISPGHH